MLRQAYEQTGLQKKESGFLLVDTLEDQEVIGYVRYTFIPYPDADMHFPEIGFGIPLIITRGQGYAKEAVRLIIAELFAGYPVERFTAIKDQENFPAQHVMESVGFQGYCILRLSMFRDG